MANSITLTDIAANRIFAGDRANASVPVAGTYSCTSTETIQVQTVDTTGDIYQQADVYAVNDIYFMTGSVVTSWANLTTVGPGSGNYNGTLSVPIHSSKMRLQVRFADLSATANGANVWGVGYIFVLIGQSNMANLWQVLAYFPPGPYPDLRNSVYFVIPSLPPQWQLPGASAPNSGPGMIELANVLSGLFNAPVGLVLGAVGGTAMDAATAASPGYFGGTSPNWYWLRQGGNSAKYDVMPGADYLYQAVADAIQSGPNNPNGMQSDVSGFAWLQGESDANAGLVSQSAYLGDLQTLYARFLALCPQRTTANCMFHVGVIGFGSGGSNPSINSIRSAQIFAGLSGGGFQLGPCIYDVPPDGATPIHHTPNGYITMGRRWAASLAYWQSPGTFWVSPGTSPYLTSATRAGANILMTVQQPPGGAFLFVGQPLSEATGFLFSTDGFASTLPAPPIIRPAGGTDITHVVAQLATDPGKQVQIQHMMNDPPSGGPVGIGSLPDPYLLNYIIGGRNPPAGNGGSVDALPLPLLHTGGLTSFEYLPTQDFAEFGGVPIFPTLPGLGWSITREAVSNTNVQENIGGQQFAFAYWGQPKYRWTIRFEFLRSNLAEASQPTQLEMQTLMGFFNQLFGRLKTFLYIDPDDFQVSGQFLTVADGVTTDFQLTRTLSGGGTPENIYAPNFDIAPTGLPSWVTVQPTADILFNGASNRGNWVYYPYGNAIPKPPGTFHCGVAPARGTYMTVTMWYYWPCRFDDDKMTFDKFVAMIYENKKITFTSVFN